LRKEGDDFWLQCDAFKVKIHPDRARKIRNLGAYIDKEVIFGIRPEDINDAKMSPSTPDDTVVARVDVTEPMGAEVVVYFSKGESQFIGRLEPHTEKTDGEEHPVTVNMKKIHLFDKDTEQVIS